MATPINSKIEAPDAAKSPKKGISRDSSVFLEPMIPKGREHSARLQEKPPLSSRKFINFQGANETSPDDQYFETLDGTTLRL